MRMPPTSRRRFLHQVVAAAGVSPLLPTGTWSALESTAAAGRSSGTPILVTLWFDTEDYILPEDDDATLRLATMLTDLGVKATFKIVGEKARVLEQRGRRDVIAALRKHEIGFHSNTHSQQPTIAVYLQHAGWEDGIAEFMRRESPGAKDVARVFGVTPVAYGQPGSAWAPQAYPALRQMGIQLYLDEADHVGIDNQPFYYGGMLNVFRMRSNVVRMELAGGSSLADGKAAFSNASDALRARGGGTISIYYHPNEWVHTEFWDAVNFSRGANPPRSEWKRPGTRPAQETERAFADFEQYIGFVKAQPGVQFVTASDLVARYADAAHGHAFTPAELLEIARGCRAEVGFLRRQGRALSAAETFGLLTTAVAAFAERGTCPAVPLDVSLDGPARPFAPAEGRVAASDTLPWEAYVRAVRDCDAFMRTTGRVPDEIWIGAASMSPADFLATTASVLEALVVSNRAPEKVVPMAGRFTADRYVADDTPALWGWPIFPEGFHAPAIMALARLQAWTLKPAILRG
jgi:hypothetical protein